MKDPEFELRRPECVTAEILIAGRNFGCGSSREHAAWALQDYGFDVVIAPSFGDIFRTNALKIGLLPVQLPAEDVRALMERAPAAREITVDLERRSSSTRTDASSPSRSTRSRASACSRGWTRSR